jgi:hypothetical protein
MKWTPERGMRPPRVPQGCFRHQLLQGRPKDSPSRESNRRSRVVEHEYGGLGVGKNIFDEKVSLEVSGRQVRPACK